MKVLMLGWEFPPHFSGGLGIVCYELTKAMSSMNVETTYVMPTGPRDMRADFVDLLIMNNMALDKNIHIKTIPALLTPYVTSEQYQLWLKEKMKSGDPSHSIYSPNLFQEVQRFALQVEALLDISSFDIIHAHDWLTFLAGVRLKEKTGKPLVVHVHATEFDRTGDSGVNQFVYDVERMGMHNADVVIAVSERIKNRCVHQYGVPPEKVRVVYNAVSFPNTSGKDFHIGTKDKVVLFLGRITLQKGPDYFIEAARKALDIDPNIKFIMAGTGDMLPRMIQRAAELGMANKFLFPGFVSREQAERLYRMADLFVMPSVSEPFGIVPLEAMSQDTPVIISKQSGVAEVIRHCIKVDFWDVDEMAEKMLAVLNYRGLHSALRQHGNVEVKRFDWEVPASECMKIYSDAIKRCLV